MSALIQTEGLTRRFGKQTAVAGIDLSVPEGSVYAFLGQNGAGKTTTIRMILGLLRPSAGRVSVAGYDLAHDRVSALRLIGSLVETPALYDRLTGRENLEITRKMLDAPKSETSRVLEVVDLAVASERLVGGYSLGMRQRLGLARAMIGRPPLLILDEPVNGLDPQGIREMRDLIRSLPQTGDVTVFVSSHLLDEVEQIATHVGLMHHGRLLTQESLGSLLKAERQTISLITADTPRALEMLRAQGHIVSMTSETSLSVDVGPDESSEALAIRLNQVLVENDVGVSGLSRSGATLEQVYMRLTGGDIEAGPPK